MNLFDYSKDFALDPQQIWLNVASEGPLPKVANDALQEAIKWKSAPHLLTIPKFQSVPIELKKSIAKLIHVDHNEIILGNSATYGIHLLVHGIDFKKYDEILLLQNDFPTDILPWLSLQEKGVHVRQIKAQHHVLSPQEIEKSITKHTRLICLPLIHSFSGFKHDIKAIGQICRLHGILLVVNISQAAGAFETDLSQWGIDAVVCAGYKWLLGPYGTGFCWMRKELREQLIYCQNYWISMLSDTDLNTEGDVVLKTNHTSRRYDVFGTANFFNFVPWQASIEYLLSIGISRIHEHNQSLAGAILDGIDQEFYTIISPQEESSRTNLIVLSLKNASKNSQLMDYLKSQGIHLALWRNKIRVSPHIYNTIQDIERLLAALNAYANP